MEGQLDYRRALRYQLDDAQWGMTLLFVTLAMLVPLVGPVVAFGYQSTVVEALARGGAGASPPRFDFARLADYLMRGLRMFVVSLVFGFLLAPILFVVIFTGNLTAALLLSRDGIAARMFGCVAVGGEVLIFLAVMVFGVALITPLLVRAALDKDLGGIFDMAFLRDFLARTWRECVVAHVVHLGISLGLFVAGLLACGIGIFPAVAYGTLVHAHLLGQLYLLYLSRGGRQVVLG
jgi:hypothetical protein